jgi:hypothetical protein
MLSTIEPLPYAVGGSAGQTRILGRLHPTCGPPRRSGNQEVGRDRRRRSGIDLLATTSAKEILVLAKRILMSVLFSMLAATAGQAATLVSPPLVPEGKSFLDCYLVNVSDEPRDVRIEVFSREGEVIQFVETTLEPGEEDVARATSPELPRYCKFIVDGTRAEFRASILVRRPGIGSISALSAN